MQPSSNSPVNKNPLSALNGGRNFRQKFAAMSLHARETERRSEIEMGRSPALKQETDSESASVFSDLAISPQTPSTPLTAPASPVGGDAIMVPLQVGREIFQLEVGKGFPQSNASYRNVSELWLMGGNLCSIPDSVAFFEFIANTPNLKALKIYGDQPLVFNSQLDFFPSIAPFIQHAANLQRIVFEGGKGIYTMEMVQCLVAAIQTRAADSKPLVVSFNHCALTSELSAFYSGMQYVLKMPAVASLLVSGAIQPTIMFTNPDESAKNDGVGKFFQRRQSALALHEASFDVSGLSDSPRRTLGALSPRRLSLTPSIYGDSSIAATDIVCDLSAPSSALATPTVKVPAVRKMSHATSSIYTPPKLTAVEKAPAETQENLHCCRML
jgi:hypothetical protein